MSSSRRHHFVPQLLQRRFTDCDGRLFVFDKSRPELGIFATNPVNAFVKRDLNTVIYKDGTRDAGLESWYAELEGRVAPVIEKIISKARARKTPRLTEDERNVWDNFVYHQQKRAPDVFERLGVVSNFEQHLPRLLEQFEREARRLTDQERREICSPDAIKRIIQRASVTARGRGSKEVIVTLASRGIAVALITKPNKSFILGDHPQSRMGPTGKLGHPATELWLPIASDVAVSPWGESKHEELIDIEGGHVRQVNEVIFAYSNVVAARSERLLQSLARL